MAVRPYNLGYLNNKPGIPILNNSFINKKNDAYV
jgi:hypothetical protein